MNDRATGLLLISGLLLGLGPAGVASASDIPRTPAGRPHLSGNYDIGNLTPMQRRPEHGERLFLTPAEAEEIRLSAATRSEKRATASDPDRQAPPAGGSIGGYNDFYMDRGTQAVAVDGTFRGIGISFSRSHRS